MHKGCIEVMLTNFSHVHQILQMVKVIGSFAHKFIKIKTNSGVINQKLVNFGTVANEMDKLDSHVLMFNAEFKYKNWNGFFYVIC